MKKWCVVLDAAKAPTCGDWIAVSGLCPGEEETARFLFLDGTQADGFTFLETAHGRGRTRSGLGTSMRKWCDKAGLPLCSSHGLRKAICRRIAEAGGGPFEIMSVSGHVTLSEAQRYCETFGRKALSDSAMERIGGTKNEQNVTNHPDRFVNNNRKPMKGNGK